MPRSDSYIQRFIEDVCGSMMKSFEHQERNTFEESEWLMIDCTCIFSFVFDNIKKIDAILKIKDGVKNNVTYYRVFSTGTRMHYQGIFFKTFALMALNVGS